MDETPITSTVAHRPGSTAASTTRLTVTALFVAALLGFLLPFGTVSCGTPVTFTGIQLATATVPGHDADEREFASEIESNGTAVAALALATIATGLGLVVARFGGWGVAAVAGLLFLLLLPWIASGAMSEFELHEGYVLSVGSLCAIAAIRRVERVARRRSRGLRRWPAVLAGIALVVPIVLTLILAASSDPYV